MEKLKGFRSANSEDQNLSALGTGHLDVVVDVWPNDPVIAESAARLLKDRTNHLRLEGFCSSGVTEAAALALWNGTASSDNRGKAESEWRLRAIVGEKLTIVRPWPIKGVRNDTPDVLVWLRRLRNGQWIIAPGDGTDAELVWIPKAFLRAQDLYPQNSPDGFGNFPYWRPEAPRRNFFRISSQKAFETGWHTRPFRDTALDYLMDVASCATLSSKIRCRPQGRNPSTVAGTLNVNRHATHAME